MRSETIYTYFNPLMLHVYYTMRILKSDEKEGNVQCLKSKKRDVMLSCENASNQAFRRL